ncbi:putative SC4G2.10, pglZ; bacteriophage (PhiC31) resistance gene pglZ [Bradyrhizobium sp. ORS 375]|uniref:BREX-2 system phosphatase PglZ n=1 Tax=Bradyrhizobium sp. (strain ORS 375) TaxID=566679 RepID=UPI0002408ABA|nr:BREX-2 system phosphatase PglZ [Bradyrhizobium sp. ORS 375]CCD90939.1 putative SC4G2.10, pglZ; bacteriophage (PhiC31) resistance gene pglZ [Bradyrhizobium sp. ORS 375]
MTEAPLLSDADIRLEVERLFRRDHRSKLLALFGRGQLGHIDLDGLKWEIIPTSCELELRSKLPAPGAPPTTGSVYLVDWAEDALPLDVSCRLAGGRIYHVARDARLAALFGARQVDQGLVSTALARLVLSGSVDGLRKITGLRLTTNDLCKRVLEARFGTPESALESGTAWLRWVRNSDAGTAFARACEGDGLLRAVRHELFVWVGERLGSVGILGFRAWELGLVDRAIEALLLLAAVEKSEDAYLRGLVNGQIASIAPGLANEVRDAHEHGSAEALIAAVLSVENEADRRLLELAQQHAMSGGASALAAASDWLPAGHAAREEAVAAALTTLVDSPSADSMTAVLTAFDHLSAHRLDRIIRGSEHIEARKMAARLSAWLLARRVRPQLAEHGTPWQPAIELARRYTEEGGFLDWARQSARGMRGAGDALMTAVHRLCGAIDAEARADDQRFAQAYVSWIAAGKPSNEVLPIEDVTKRVVAQFLKGGQHRRLLLVLMDGMSYATAVQILQRLRDQRRWSPIAWRTPNWSGQLPIPPVLATAPTLTQVSRAALFAGVADPRFGDQGTDKDEERWASNPHVRELVGEEPLNVFFRREILAGHELTEEVKKAIADDERVVAVIVNAVDEQLKGSLQVAVDYSKTSILPLEALLSAAGGAERAVLLVADHGHAAGDAMRVASGRIPVGREGGARWRALAEGEQPQDGEVLLPRSSWKPRGSAGIAALWDTTLANRAPNYGEHGGLSLAEAVAPAFLIGPEWLDRVADDDVELSCRVLPEPDWWALKIARPATVPVAPIKEPKTPKAQLELLPVEQAKTPIAPPEAPTEPTLVARLRTSKLFTLQIAGVPKADVERVLTWLTVLVDAGGSMTAADFARLCGVRPHQVGGVVARMGVLNADGFAIVEHDVAGRRVVLHKARLLSQFGVTE